MSYEFFDGSDKKKNKQKIIILLSILGLGALFVATSTIYLEIVQFNEIGNYADIFIKNLSYQALFFVSSFFVIFASLFITNHYIKRNVHRFIKAHRMPQKAISNYPIIIGISVIGALISQNILYQNALYYFNATSFGTSDPIFGVDVSYYVFRRPFLMSLYDFCMFLSVFIVIYAVVYYIYVYINIPSTPVFRDIHAKPIFRHNLINIAIYFFIKAFSYKFQNEGILYSKFIDVDGAGYVDVNIWLNYFKYAPFLLGIIVILSFLFIWLEKLRYATITITVFPIAWFVAVIIASIYQYGLIKPNELDYEKPYLKYNMEQTRKAYNISNMRGYTFPSVEKVTSALMDKNPGTAKNIRIVENKALLDTNRQLQSLTSFYNIPNGDMASYEINGVNTPVFIAAREIDTEKMKLKSYLNKTFQYTHGYGVVINPINRITSQGQNDYIVSGLNHETTDKKLVVNEPRIYYGEKTDDYVIVNEKGSGKVLETDYDGSRTTQYSGKGGVALGFFKRLFFSLKYSDINMLISGNINTSSRLLMNRNVVERAQLPVPFISIDSNALMVLTSDGRLKWVLDGYTKTMNYPYAMKSDGFNYIRNSVKVVVDAYDGTVQYYIIDPLDPIIMTLSKIYPGVFIATGLPEDIKKHMRYPEKLFNIQAEVLRRYHLNPYADQDINLFYNRLDSWNFATVPATMPNKSSVADKPNTMETKTEIEPYYSMMKLPGGIGNKEEFVLVRPFTPIADRNNMASWLAVRNSAENYGQMVLFTFPKTSNIFGTYQVDLKINQIDAIAKDINLWNSSGSEVSKGNLLVIPIESSILYVEPIYIKSSAQSIPEVRLIIVGYQAGNEFIYGYGSDLDVALSDLYQRAGMIENSKYQQRARESVNGDEVPIETNPPAKTEENLSKIEEIKAKYKEIKKQLDELGEIISNLNDE